MLRLPPENSKLRELFDTANLADRASPEKRGDLPTVLKARRSAVRELQNPAVSAVTYITLRASGDINLTQFRIVRGELSIKHLFNFGQ
jgi:hypothetical protein